MMTVKCMFCSKPTTFHTINAKKNVNGKIITMKNSPVYYCADCDETFISKETQDAFNYIRDKRLAETGMLFDYEVISKKLG